MKSLSGIEVGEEALAWQAIDEVARDEGHCLGRTETLERLQGDLVYPEIGDRRSIAIDSTRQILQQHYPRQLRNLLDRALRDRFDIPLPRSAMEAS